MGCVRVGPHGAAPSGDASLPTAFSVTICSCVSVRPPEGRWACGPNESRPRPGQPQCVKSPRSGSVLPPPETQRLDRRWFASYTSRHALATTGLHSARNRGALNRRCPRASAHEVRWRACTSPCMPMEAVSEGSDEGVWNCGEPRRRAWQPRPARLPCQLGSRSHPRGRTEVCLNWYIRPSLADIRTQDDPNLARAWALSSSSRARHLWPRAPSVAIPKCSKLF